MLFWLPLGIVIGAVLSVAASVYYPLKYDRASVMLARFFERFDK